MSINNNHYDFSLLTISIAHAFMLFIRPVHSKVFLAFNCSVNALCLFRLLCVIWCQQMNPPAFNRKSQTVMVTELKNVVATTVLEVSVPSCPIFFAMI